jgi:hypothetical protein
MVVMNDEFFAPRPFNPADALLQLKRSLRELRPLAERGDGFELQGKRVIDVRCDEATITVHVAKRPAVSPDFDTVVIKNSADVRKCVDDVKKRLARWTEE